MHASKGFDDKIGFVVNIVKSRNWCDKDLLICTFHMYISLSCYCHVRKS